MKKTIVLVILAVGVAAVATAFLIFRNTDLHAERNYRCAITVLSAIGAYNQRTATLPDAWDQIDADIAVSSVQLNTWAILAVRNQSQANEVIRKTVTIDFKQLRLPDPDFISVQRPHYPYRNELHSLIESIRDNQMKGTH